MGETSLLLSFSFLCVLPCSSVASCVTGQEGDTRGNSDSGFGQLSVAEGIHRVHQGAVSSRQAGPPVSPARALPPPSAPAHTNTPVPPGHAAGFSAAFRGDCGTWQGTERLHLTVNPCSLRGFAAASGQLSSAPSHVLGGEAEAERGNLVKPAEAATTSCSWKQFLNLVLFNCSCHCSKQAAGETVSLFFS